uniref:Uncharacterized protein n=1 Tax=Anguilla anguilla TaxID=7936 RepID=A0A0E9V0D1_ANGAN
MPLHCKLRVILKTKVMY